MLFCLNNGLIVETEGINLFYVVMSRDSETLYYIKYLNGIKNNIILTISSESLSMCLWHHLFGHLSLLLISSIIDWDLVKRLKISLLSVFDHICSRYIYGKSHQLSLPDSNAFTYLKIELVIMDLMGLYQC